VVERGDDYVLFSAVGPVAYNECGVGDPEESSVCEQDSVGENYAGLGSFVCDGIMPSFFNEKYQ